MSNTPSPLIQALMNLGDNDPEDAAYMRFVTKGGASFYGHPYGVQLDRGIFLVADKNLNIVACISIHEIAGWSWEGDWP